mmetsp:Transcript_7676/g.28743  ORF Transcript_7676/g.28743 Transcript_7676/m.28743 type:complete len:235 (-) Transcript_7676:196-900(-)
MEHHRQLIAIRVARRVADPVGRGVERVRRVDHFPIAKILQQIHVAHHGFADGGHDVVHISVEHHGGHPVKLLLRATDHGWDVIIVRGEFAVVREVIALRRRRDVYVQGVVIGHVPAPDHGEGEVPQVTRQFIPGRVHGGVRQEPRSHFLVLRVQRGVRFRKHHRFPPRVAPDFFPSLNRPGLAHALVFEVRVHHTAVVGVHVCKTQRGRTRRKSRAPRRRRRHHARRDHARERE